MKERNWEGVIEERTENIPTERERERVETEAVTESMWGDMSRGTRIKRYCSVHIIITIIISFMQGFIHVFLRQTMSLGNAVFQLFCHYCLWCLYR